MRMIPLILVVSVFALTGCDTSIVMTTSVLERKANEFFQSGEYEESLRFCNRLCSRRNDDFAAWELRTQVHIELGHYEHALDDALHAWELQSDSMDALELRSMTYSVNDMHQEAVNDLNALIESAPEIAGYHVALGHEYQQSKQYSKAIECYQKAMNIDDRCSMAWSHYASIFCMSTDPEFLDGIRARRYASQAIKVAQTDLDKSCAWDVFGAALAQLGDYKHAQKAGKKAIGFASSKRVIRNIKTNINGYKRSEPARQDVTPYPVLSQTESASPTS